MDVAYGARYRELYRRHWWWRARERVILDAIRRHQPRDGWTSVLDVGCGDGLFFDTLAALPGVRHVEGVEPDATLVSPDGPHRARIHVQPFDARFQPGRRYSLIVMLDVLEHLADPDAALRQVHALLEPDGVFIATVPAFMALWTRHDTLNHHYVRYTKRSAERVASEAGLHVEHARYFFHWTALAKLATRLLEAVIPGEPKPPSLPPTPINRALYLASRTEEMLLRRARIPFGSSLLLVAGR